MKAKNKKSTKAKSKTTKKTKGKPKKSASRARVSAQPPLIRWGLEQVEKLSRFISFE